MAARRRKIAVLGGGVGAMAAAFALTDTYKGRDLSQEHQVTVYQMGWRLGGKGASGRNLSAHGHGRIEEHGLHIWFGFYDNSFALIQRCYQELNRPDGAPLARWSDAFKPHSFVMLEEHLGRNDWLHLPVSFWTNDEVPGRGEAPPEPWDYVPLILDQLLTHFEASGRAPRLRRVGVVPLRPPPPLWSRLAALVGPEVARRLGGLEHRFLEYALRLARTLDADPRRHYPHEHDALLWLIDHFMRWLWDALGADVEHDTEARRLWVISDLAQASIRGMIEDRLIWDGFDVVNDEEWRGWLRRHGASQLTLASPWLRAAYDLVFAYHAGDVTRPVAEAGTALRSVLRMLFTYRGAMMWKMQAGMGDTIFAPVYEVLRRRGVEFEFFQRVTDLRPSADHRLIDAIEIERQVQLKKGAYQPLCEVRGLPCWPNQPLWDQIVDGDQLEAEGANPESYWWRPKDPTPRTLRRGRDFDDVVLGISLGAVPLICRDLVAASPRWRTMVEKVEVVRTQAFQLWLKPNLHEMGWRNRSPVMGAYVEPLDTWADMSQLLVREAWPDDLAPGNIGYFCGPMADDPDHRPGDFSDPTYPRRQAEKVKAAALEFLRNHFRHLLPDAAQPSSPSIDWELLVDPEQRTGERRFDGQFWRANIDPTELYVLSAPGSSKHRLAAERSGVANLFLAGDWTRTGLNAGCVEAAVMSGLQAARGVCGLPVEIVGESDFAHTRRREPASQDAEPSPQIGRDADRLEHAVAAHPPPADRARSASYDAPIDSKRPAARARSSVRPVQRPIS